MNPSAVGTVAPTAETGAPANDNAGRSKTTSTRLSINVNAATAEALQRLARERDTSVTDIVRRAVGVYAFIEQQVAAGKVVQVADEGETVTLHLLP